MDSADGVDSWHSCGGYGSAGEQPERRHEAKDWAEWERSALLVSAQFLAESDKLTHQPISVCAIGGSLLDRFAVEMMAVLAPRMVGRRGLGQLELVIEGLGIGYLRLAGWLVEDGVG